MKNIALLFILLAFGSVTAQNNFPEFPEVETPQINATIDTAEIAELQLLPNPVSNYLQIQLPMKWQNEIHYSVADVYGKVVIAEQNVNPPAENFKHVLAVEDLPAGVYLLKIRNGNERITKRFEVR